MNANKPKLNDSKTEFIIFGAEYNLKKVKTTTISIGKVHVTASSSVRNVGAYIVKRLKMDIHMANIGKAAWHNLYTIGKIPQY